MYIRKASAAIDKTIVITWFLVFFDSYIKVFPTPCNKLTNIFSLWDECIYVCFTFSVEKKRVDESCIEAMNLHVSYQT